MFLGDGRIGKAYRIEDMQVELDVERRLRALGMTKETQVTVMNKKRNGCIIFKVRGTRLAVGQRIAGAIRIEEMGETGGGR